MYISQEVVNIGGSTYCSSVFYAVCSCFYTSIFPIFSILHHHIYYTKYFVTDGIIKGSSKKKELVREIYYQDLKAFLKSETSYE